MSQPNSTSPIWVPLHVHSQYSILDASASVEDIAAQAAAYNMPAVALTDHGNLFGAIDFYKACKDKKVKPIIGCEMYVAPQSRHDKKKIPGKPSSFHLTLIAKNLEGYRNLCKLSSIGYLEGFYFNPRIDKEVLQQYSKGLICLSGCHNSHIAYEILNGTKEKLLELIQWYQSLFGEDYYFELMRHHMRPEDISADGIDKESWLFQNYESMVGKQTKVNNTLLELSKQLNIKTVATNDSHYMARDDWYAHEILLNIQSGEPCEILELDSEGRPKFRGPNPKRATYFSHEFYFKSQEQMALLFKDVPEALAHSLEIAHKCSLEIDFKTKHYPKFIPPGFDANAFENEEIAKKEQALAVEKFLWKLCEEGIPKRYTPDRLAKVKEHFPDKDPMEIVRERLAYELNVIIPKGMSDYLLIVWDFIYWAKTNGIPMGPGRGSGAGSIVLYLIGVTDIEPLRFSLFFERFINPERISYPDIDVDICMDRRNEVINYTLQKYGKENIAQIITFMTMKAKTSIKDVGRVLSVPLSKCNAIAKLVPEDLNMTLDKALEIDPELKLLYEQDEDAHRIIDIGRKLEGSIRSTGIHAAGVIICGEPLTQFIPLCNAKDAELDMAVTQYSMKPVELVGMLKMDFLGLKTLTSIEVCLKAVKENTGKEIDWINLPLDDAPTFELLNQGKTLGVFQLESSGMQDLARQLHLDRFEEIIAVGALYRPGPMDMIPSFINRKHGREPIENDHPWMKDILAETYGIMVYQEQVMQIASKLANYSLGEGDVLRRAMGKKDLEQMAAQREKFRLGALQNGISEEISMNIFNKMEKFAAYGFNKSHAAAYAYLSYVTSFLKANYPKEWLAALMTCDRHDLEKVAKFMREGQSMNIAMLPPDINESGEYFVATPQGIRFAMVGIKGVGSGVVEAIVSERNRKGKFKSFYEFFKRIDTGKVGKKIIEHLVLAGCFDFTGWTREALVASIEPMYESASREHREKEQGFLNLFSMGGKGDPLEARFAQPPKVENKLSRLDKLLKEKEYLGMFLTGHPMDEYRESLQKLGCIPLNLIENMSHDNVFRAAFLVEAVSLKMSHKTQRKFAILTISDGMESYEISVWSDLFEEKQFLFRENMLLFGVLHKENSQITCKWIDDLTKLNDAMIVACNRNYDNTQNKIVKSSAFKTKTKSFSNGSNMKENGNGSIKIETNKIVINSHISENQSQEIKEVTKIQSMTSVSVQKVEQGNEFNQPCLRLKVDADTVTLGHIVDIKEIFSQHRGTTPVQISFEVQGQQIATLDIETRWGVINSEVLHQKLRSIPSIL